MKVAITGASGFIGQEVVKQVLTAGHDVIALVRSKGLDQWQNQSNISIATCDLASGEDLADKLAGADIVIHLAAVMSGADLYHQTQISTDNLLKAMDKAGVSKLIACSSISVLDYAQQTPLSVIDENTPLNSRDEELGAYALMKRDQEKQILAWYDDSKSLCIFRPGLVFAKDNLSTAHVGFKVLAAKHIGQVPVVHVKSVAKAMASALEQKFAGEVFNLTNDNLPSQSQYLAKLKSMGAVGTAIGLPWQLYAFVASCFRLPLSIINKVPDAFCLNSVAARQKPFHFSNQKAKDILQWKANSALED